MSYIPGITESLDRIFGGILIGELTEDNPNRLEIIKAAQVNMARFLGNFPSNIFNDEYAVFYDIIGKHGGKVFSANQLSAIIDNNRDLILDSPYLDLSVMSHLENGAQLLDDDKIEVIKRNMIDVLKTLSNKLVTIEEFNSSCLIFIDYFKNNFLQSTAHHIVAIMSDAGYDEKKPNKRSQHYSGFADAQKYYNERNRILHELSAENRVRTTVMNMDQYLEQKQRDEQPDTKELMSIGITKIDEMMGKLRRSNMIGILGPPKGGKTRFSNFLVQRALSLGLNVCVWPLEGTKEEWQAMQVASYIARKNPGIEIDSKAILSNSFEDAQQRSLVNTAKWEMVTDPSYGTLSFIESIAYVEDFIPILESHYDNDNPFDVVVIDSLVNIQSKTGRNKVDRISSGYMELKAFISNGLKRPALAIVPAQLKQEAVDFLRKNPNETIDVTAGGESAETIRSPDEVLGLFSTKEERAAGFMKIYSVASRHSGNFDDIQVRTSLKCCHFYDE